MLAVWSFCNRGKRKVATCRRGETGGLHPRPSRRRTNRSALPFRPHTTLEYIRRHILALARGRFIYFVCMCCAVQRDEGERRRRSAKGAGAEWFRSAAGVDERAFRVWSLDSPLHAAFKLYFSPSPKITFARYSISPRDGEAPGKMTRMVSGEFSQAPYILPLRVSGKLWETETRYATGTIFSAHIANFFSVRGRAIRKISELRSLHKPISCLSR